MFNINNPAHDEDVHSRCTSDPPLLDAKQHHHSPLKGQRFYKAINYRNDEAQPTPDSAEGSTYDDQPVLVLVRISREEYDEIMPQLSMPLELRPPHAPAALLETHIPLVDLTKLLVRSNT